MLVVGVGLGGSGRLVVGYRESNWASFPWAPPAFATPRFCSTRRAIRSIRRWPTRRTGLQLVVRVAVFPGVSAGLFDIPLEAYLQLRSDPRVRGSILAANNFISYTCMLGAAGLFWLMQTQFHWQCQHDLSGRRSGHGPRRDLCRLPHSAGDRPLRGVDRQQADVSAACARARELAADRRSALVANHVSWLDGVLLLLVSTRPIRMLAYSDYVSGWWINWLATMWNVIPIRNTDGPKALIQSLRSAKEALIEGDLVCIFAEGGITRNGQLQPFQPADYCGSSTGPAAP